MTQIIAIANEKGGVAKTTTSISLGGALVEMGKDVLLVDLDPQANLSLALGLSPHNVRRSIADVLLNSATALSVSRETSIPGLDLIPSNTEMGMAERFLPIRQNYKHTLRQALDQIRVYDTIIVDCPPSMGALTQNALAAANLLIIPTQAEYFSAYALRNVMGAIRSIRAQDNPALTYRILITMLDMRIGSHKVLRKQLHSTFGKSVFETEIQIDSKLRESTIAGLPITHYVPRSRGAQQYRALAQELTQYVKTNKFAQPA
ncbi:MAG: ParA family protein [Chloroflexi bacterium]|nr:ParA family protein [Chloroflexota bacterium]MBU1662556.1 ParA family protein [Chloroflexota bacterium]